MPIEPIDPSKKPDGDGKEKYSPEEKRGPGKFDEVLEKAKTDRAKAEISKMAEDFRAKTEAERPRTYTERLQDMGRLPKGGGGGGMGGNKLSNRDLTKAYKTGGKVSSASKRADGCCVKGKTKGRMV
jgi:hypothetical protein